MLKRLFLVGFLAKAKHRDGYTPRLAVIYCFLLASAYVAALYLMVPKKVRKLDRDHVRHIRYRVVASIVVSLGAIITYPLFFCAKTSDETRATFSFADILLNTKFCFGIFCHTTMIYFGSIVTSLLQIGEERKAVIARGEAQGIRKPVAPFMKVAFRRAIRPTMLSFLNPVTPDERWKSIRNLIVAPWTEEVVFRGCMVSCLVGSGLSPWKVALVSPLFFGVAHIHHAITRLSKGEALQPVLFVTAFQFIYTSLFGAYASYAFYRTGSVTAVTLSHAYCNWMGLPDLSFVQPSNSTMFQHRKMLLSAFIGGVFAFKWGFSNRFLLPDPAQLPLAIHGEQ